MIAKVGSSGCPVRVSKPVGTQYAARFAVPPWQVELPVVAIESGVEPAFVSVLPKNVCRWDFPGWPGLTIGSSNAMCEYSQDTRNAPMSSPAFGTSNGVLRTRESAYPAE